MFKRGLKLSKYTENSRKNQNDTLVIEKQLTLILNNIEITTFNTIPSHEKELITGYLFANQLITSKTDIKEINQEKDIIRVTTTAEKKENQNTDKKPSTIKIQPINIYQLTAYFQEKALLFKDTAITESAAIATPKEIQYFSEDLARINAFYKALGFALNQDQTQFQNSILLTSGKIDYQLIKLANNLEIPIIVSRTGPTDKAFDFAEAKGITLIGFARGRRFNLYTGTI